MEVENLTPNEQALSDALRDLEAGLIGFEDLPESVQESILSGSPLAAAPETPAVVEEGSQGAVPGNGPKVEEEVLGETAALKKKIRELQEINNQVTQKLNARDSLLDRMATDKDAAIEYLGKRGMKLVPGEDPRTTARIAELHKPSDDSLHGQQLLELPPMDSIIDKAVSEVTDALGETFTVADQKFSQIYNAFKKEDRMADFQSFMADPAYQKQVYEALGVEPIKDLAAYTKINRVITAWNTAPDGVELTDFLRLYGMGSKKPAASSVPNIPAAPVRRADEVPIMPTGQGNATPPNTMDLSERIIEITARYDRDPYSITDAEKKLILSALL